jgi:hypothetical protein
VVPAERVDDHRLDAKLTTQISLKTCLDAILADTVVIQIARHAELERIDLFADDATLHRITDRIEQSGDPRTRWILANELTLTHSTDVSQHLRE